VSNDGTIQAEGDLVWGSYDLSEAHAGDLLEVAERGLEDGCPPAAPPTERLRKPAAAIGSGHASASSVRRTFDDLWAALAAHRPASCPSR
jgi:hypothetical protein